MSERLSFEKMRRQTRQEEQERAMRALLEPLAGLTAPEALRQADLARVNGALEAMRESPPHAASAAEQVQTQTRLQTLCEIVPLPLWRRRVGLPLPLAAALALAMLAAAAWQAAEAWRAWRPRPAAPGAPALLPVAGLALGPAPMALRLEGGMTLELATQPFVQARPVGMIEDGRLTLELPEQGRVELRAIGREGDPDAPLAVWGRYVE